MVALDYGRRRIGVATSDPTRTIASPHSVVPNTGDPVEPPERLLQLLEELDPGTVVLGVPLEMDGSEGEMAREVRTFGSNLEERLDCPVVEWDERLSTEAARRALVESGASRRKRREKGTADMMAATLLLKAYLASGPRPDAEGTPRGHEGPAEPREGGGGETRREERPEPSPGETPDRGEGAS